MLSDILSSTGIPFEGAAIPVALHEARSSEATFDAAEWAAELIVTQGGRFFVCLPTAIRDATALSHPLAVGPRSWNHAIAMVRRLEAMCQRYGLELVVPEERNGALVDDSRLDLHKPIGYVLDTAGLAKQGMEPRRLTARPA